MQLSDKDIAAFAEWSGDRNPLHVDAVFARRTFFGGPIAHGMLSVAAATANPSVAAAHPTALEIEFKGAVRPDVTCDVRTVEQSASFDLSVRFGEEVLLSVRATRETASPAFDVSWAAEASARGLVLRTEPIRRRDEELEAGFELRGLYATGSDESIPLLRENRLHPVQVRALALCSYLVGMEVPGLNSLFTRASLRFAATLQDSGSLLFRARVVRFDRHFRMLETAVDIATATGAPIGTAVLRSYVRFSPVVTDLDDLAARLDGQQPLAGQVALVCGGTRGLGADITCALALAGARVYGSFHHDPAASRELAARLAAHRAEVDFVDGDAGDPVWCQSIVETIRERHRRLDLLVLNACAAPSPLRLDASTADRFSAYIADNLRLVQTPLAAAMPTLHESGGRVVYISSSFVDDAPAGFAHYVAVKQAGESLVRTAAHEWDRVSAVVARPPRLRTSWNDTPTGVLGTIPSDWVASRLIEHVSRGAEPRSVSLLTEFLPFESRATAASPVPGAAPYSLALSASFTADPLMPGLRFWAREVGIDLTIDNAPYGQILQTLLDPTGVFAKRARGSNVILLRVSDWLRELPTDAAASPDFVAAHFEKTASDFERAIRAHAARGGNATFLVVCPSSSATPDIDALVAKTEREIASRSEGLAGVRVITAADFHARYGVAGDAIEDSLRDHIGHIPYRDGYFHVLAAIVMRHVHRTIAPIRKVIAVDADNTLWRGVVGEVGPGGVAFDAAHRELHAALTRLAASGVLVAICSKNEEADVWEVFDTRPEFGLKREQVVGGAINWLPKSQNLRALASRLNLGIDSFVFIDDNPVECAEVRANCPEVLTIQWPQEPDAALGLLHHMWELDPAPSTAEDARRTEMYREEFKRQELRDNALTLRDFLQSLELVVDISPLSAADLPRASQLTMRTNQFNFTTRRRSEAELQALLATGRHAIRTIRVRDRFGDYGLVGLVIAERLDDRVELDTFLLSCRVLGRGVEHRIVASVGEIAQEQGAPIVTLRVDFTKKNTPARQFLVSIAPQAVASETSLECAIPAADLAALTFEPADDARLETVDDGELRTASGAGPTDVSALRVREAQIVRTAALSTLDALVEAIDGRSVPSATVAVPAGEISDAVYEAFASALGIGVAAVRETDTIERLGCDSLKIVEITVALTGRFPWLPPTLLFEHRRISEIVATIASLGATGDIERSRMQPAKVPTAAETGAEIAVVGIDVRCAGASSVDELWALLLAGRTSVAPVPETRPYFLGPLRDDRPHWAGLLDDVDSFDAEFFGVSPREAELMDPQGRLLLETSWRALEDAGCVDRNRDPQTGVFVGVMYGDYGRSANSASADRDTPYKCWEGFSVANRVSQALDLRGPSIAVDTACSSSATALHLACRALAAGDCRVAVVGGVNLILDPDRFAQLGRLGILSPTGRCEAFGADADGTVLGEGVGVVVLRPLRDALERHDRIYGVIKGTGLSTGNGTVGFTAPNPQAQAEAIRKAIAAARVDPRTIGYVETHGTGTSLGDPIEVRGLTLAYGDPALHDAAVQAEPRCRLGSIKPNIGHLEAGAGVIGLIKILLQMQHRTLVPSITSPQPNPQIPFADLPFEIQRQSEPWHAPELIVGGVRTPSPRRAGLNSFGVGGANVHVIVEEPPSGVAVPAALERSAHILAVSARSDESLARNTAALAAALRGGDVSLGDLAYTLNTSREHFERRLAVVARTPADAARALDRATSGSGLVATPGPRKIAFLFTGQGSQYAGMGEALYDTQPVFRDALDRCAAILDPVIGRSLLEVLFARPSSAEAYLLDETGFTQPALFALQYALAQLWESWGVRPDVVIGHSVGEIAALCIAGGLSLEDAANLVAARGRLMQALPAGGAMSSVMAPEARVLEAVSPWSDQVAVAAVNAPEQVVISGVAAAIAEITSRFVAQGVKTKPLTVSHAFHSPLMRPMVADFRSVVSSIRFTVPRVPFVSCVTGERVTDEIVQPEYWVRQVLDPVRFTAGVTAVERSGASAYLEIGPHPVLLGMARQSIDNDDRLWLPSLRKDTDPWETMLSSLASLYSHGAHVDWRGFDAPYVRRRVSVPHYQFRQKRHWIGSPRLQQDHTARRRQPSPAGSGVATYAIEWRRHPIPADIRPAEMHWLILADRGGSGAALRQALERRGAACTVVAPDAALGTDLERVLAAATPQSERRVVDMRGLDLPAAAAASAHGVLLSGVVHIVNALAVSSDAQSPRLWLITRGAQQVRHAESCTPAQSAIWGFARTVALEQPGQWGGIVDLPADGGGSDIETLADVLLTAGDDDQLAIRGSESYVPRLVDQPFTASAPTHFSRTGSYLITGGTGALGLQTARWLADHGVRHLVLASRRGSQLAAEVQSALQALRAREVTVHVERTDMAVEDDVRTLIARFGAEFPTLSGVIHAAGLDRIVALGDLSADDIVSAMAAKADGARFLDQYTRDLDLDTFICFSSLASVLGAAGRAHYAAANAFLDGLAAQRRASGVAALTVNWGPWRGGGMADGDRLAEFERVGNRGLAAEAALSALAQAAASQLSQAVIADIDWRRFRAAYESRRTRPLIAEIGEPRSDARTGDAAAAPDAAHPGQQSSTQPEWIARLAAASAEERPAVMRTLLRDEVARTLGIDPPSDLPLDRSFYELGMDSLMTAELVGSLRKRVGMPCTALLFDNPSVTALAPRLLEAIGNAVTSRRESEALPADVRPSAASEDASGISGYSERWDAEVVAFQRRMFPDRDPEMLIPRWRWLFAESAQRVGAQPRAWIYRDSGRIGGLMGAIHVRLKAGAHCDTAAWLVDTMVLEEYRSQAIGLRLIARAQDDVPVALSLGQSADVREMLFRLGWQQVAALKIAQLLIRPENVLKRKLGRAGAWVAGVGLRAAAKMAVGPQTAAGDVREIARFDATHDALWNVMARDVQCGVVRDASFLNWKYVDQPGQQYVRLELLQNGQPVGVAVLLFRDADDVYAYRRASLVDVVAPLHDDDVLRRVVAMAIDAATRGGADSLTCMHTHPRLTHALRDCGFRLRTPQRFLLVNAATLAPDLSALVTAPDAWHLTQSDSDIDRPGRGLA